MIAALEKPFIPCPWWHEVQFTALVFEVPHVPFCRRYFAECMPFAENKWHWLHNESLCPSFEDVTDPVKLAPPLVFFPWHERQYVPPEKLKAGLKIALL
jgi:nicotinamide mononucleotide adenylyltransferase